MKPDTLQHILRRTRRRMILTSGVQRAGVGLVVGAIGGLALVGVDRIIDAGWPWWIPAGACALGAIGGFLSSVLRPPASDEMAVLLDRALGLKDRIGTAEAINRGRVRADAFAELVKRDATRVAAGIAPSSIIPWRFGRPWLVAATLVGAVAVTNAFLPSLAWSRSPAENLTPEEVAELDRAQQDVASTIERFTEPEARGPGAPIDERSREQYDRLADLAKQLQTPQNDPNAFRESRDQAASTLNQLAEEREREAEQTRESTRRLTEKFDRLTPPEERKPTSEFERALKDGDYRKAAQLLEQLDRAVNEMSPTERKAAAERLREIAESLRDAESGEAQSTDGSMSGTTAANETEQRRRLREELRGQGVEDATIDELLDRDEPVTSSDLVEQGVDPETARDLARETERARQTEKAREQADRAGEELADRFDRLADEVESPPSERNATPSDTNQGDSSPEKPNEPAGGNQQPNEVREDAANQSDPNARDQQQDQDQQQSETGERTEQGENADQQSTGGEQRTGNEQQGAESQQQQNRQGEGDTGQQKQDQQQGAEGQPQNQQQQQQQQGDGESSQQQQYDPTGQPGQQPGQQHQPGQQGTEGTQQQNQDQQQSGQEGDAQTGEQNQEGGADQEARGEEIDRNSDQSGAEQGGKQPGEQSGQQQTGDQSAEQSDSQPGGEHGEQTETPGEVGEGPQQQQQQPGGETESPEFDPENLPSAEELKKMLKEIERRRESGEQSAQDAERMREAAQEIAEKLTSEERQRLQEWAEQMQRELGRDQQQSPRQPNQSNDPHDQGDAGTNQPGGGDGTGEQHGIGTGTGTGGNETNQNPNRLNATEGETLDLRGDEKSDRTLAEIFDNNRPGEPTSTDQAIPGVVARDAKRAAEQAVNNATIHRRYHELIRRYFDKLPETLDEASKGKTGEAAKSNESSSSSSPDETAQEGGSSR